MSNKELPPLPKHLMIFDQSDDSSFGSLVEHAWDSDYATMKVGDPMFTADQMRDYARAALAAQPVAQAPDPQASNDLADAAGICAARGHELLSIRLLAYSEALAAAPSPEARQHHEQQPDGTVTAVDPAEASNPAQAEAPRWLNVESAMEDPVFQQARAIMGTENWFQDNALRNALNYVLRAAHSPASGVGEREALALDIKSAIAELASGAVYPDLLEAIDKLAAIAAQPQPCGHPASLLLTSAETGEPLYCEACDDKSGRRDAEARESELMAANRALLAELADLKRRGERRAEISSEEWEWLKHPQSAKDLADFVYEFAARNVTAQPLEQKPVAQVTHSAPDNYGANHRIKWLTQQVLPVGTHLFAAAQPEQVAQDSRPTEPGLYAWVPDHGSPSLVLVGKRPSAHCGGGVLNGQVLDSSKFYDGCAMTSWPAHGWVNLRAARAATKPQGGA